MDLVEKAKSIKTEADQQSFFEAVAQDVEDLKKKKAAPETTKQAFPPDDKMIRGSSKK